MNKRKKKLWLEALRSGEYEKCTGQLHIPGDGYCCLGVLCDLHRKDTGKGKWTIDGQYMVGDYFRTGFLPDEVQKWAGLTQHNIYLPNGRTIVKMNDYDEGKTYSFKDIADTLERIV